MQNNEIKIPDTLDKVVEWNMRKVYREHKKSRVKKTVIRIGSTAAALAAGVIFCAANPSLAARLPIIGHIFEQQQEDYTYSGDYTEIAKTLETEGDLADEESSAYTRTVDGMTVTLSEIYSSDQALYISMVLSAEDTFPDTFTDLDGNPSIFAYTSEKYSFSRDEMTGHYKLEGEFLDEYTYAGILRIDLNEKKYETIGEGQEEQEITLENYDEHFKTIEIPEQYTVKFRIDQIVGDLAEPEVHPIMDETGVEVDEDTIVDMSDEEWSDLMTSQVDLGYPNASENYWFDGSWEFDLDVEVDGDLIQTVLVEETGEHGVGVKSVIKTPVDITVEELYENAASRGEGYVPVLLDAAGKIMDESEGSMNTAAIRDHDVSTVYVYLCTWDDYMESVKGQKEEEGFKDVVEQYAVYSTVIEF